MATAAFPGSPEFPLLQGWFPGEDDHLAGAFAEAGGAALLRLPAFPDADAVRDRKSVV